MLRSILLLLSLPTTAQQRVADGNQANVVHRTEPGSRHPAHRGTKHQDKDGIVSAHPFAHRSAGGKIRPPRFVAASGDALSIVDGIRTHGFLSGTKRSTSPLMQ
jgi:hypothetical protein